MHLTTQKKPINRLRRNPEKSKHKTYKNLNKGLKRYVNFENDFWGGAVAAHQLEGGWDQGGKGVSVADVMTAGAHGVPRKITAGVLPDEHYPNHEAIDFTIAIKKIFNYSKNLV